MIKIIKSGFFSFVILLCLFSCGKILHPQKSSDNRINVYDSSAFDYIYVEALKQKVMGNNGDALNYLEQCVKINPRSDGAYYQIAQIVLNNGDIINGKKYASKALELDQNNLWYLMMLAGIYYQEKNIDSTIFYYEKAVKYFPGKENLELTLGNLYAENGNYKEAVLIFDSLDQKYGINESSTLYSVKTLLSALRYDEALIKVKLLLKEYPDNIVYNGLLAEIYQGKGERDKAHEVYDMLIAKDPDNAQSQLALCEFLIAEKSYDELFVILNTIILNSKVNREEKISLMVKLLDQADIVKDQSDHLMLSIMVLEANYKDDDIFLLFRPELLVKNDKWDEAAERLEEITKSRPGNYYAWEKLLLVYLQKKDYDNLYKKGQECATLFNRSYLAKVLYANGAIEKGEFDIALEELKKAEILAGESKDSLLQVLTMRADVYYKLKEYKKSFEVFDKALKSSQEDLTVLNNYAYYLAEQNMDLKTAEKMAKLVTEKEKGNTTFLDTYGWVLYKRGKLKDAARVMEEIVKNGEVADAVWYEHYGYILKGLKRCEEAVENWNKAIRIDNNKSNLLKEIENCKK